MRILITGIDGFVGRHLTARLAAAGHEVRGTTLSGDQDVPGARTVACDVRDAGGVAAAVSEARPDVVVHLAGQTSVADSFREAAVTFAVNAGGALNVLEASRSGAVGQVVLVTSCEVYGAPDPDRGPIREDAPLAPLSPYGASKAAADLLGYQYGRGYGMPVVRVRPFPHTGPGQDDRFLFPSVARRIARAETGEGPPTIPVGNVDVVRDLLDVRDVADAYVRLIEGRVSGEALNLCSGRPVLLREALDVLCRLARRPVELESRVERLRPADFDWMVGDPARIEERTGWRPTRAWERTMEDLLEEWRMRVSHDGGGSEP